MMSEEVMKTFYLKERKGYIVSKFEMAKDYFEGIAYDCIGWENNKPVEWQFHSEVYAKRDGCSHWWFKGEDYNTNTGKCSNDGIDSYYHICSSFNDFIRTMCFIWKLAGMYYSKEQNNEIISEEYNLPIIQYMLKDYEIIEG